MPSETPPRLEDAVLACFRGEGPGPALRHPVWLVWRRGGKALHSGWYEGDTLGAVLAQARGHAAAPPADTAELCLTEDFQPVAPADFDSRFAPNARGRLGMEIRRGATIHRTAPTTTIATNRGFRRDLDRCALRFGTTAQALLEGAAIRSFRARQMLVALGPEPRVHPLHRGNRIVPDSAIGPGLLGDTIAGLCGWMRDNLRDDGRMTYKYWPSRGRESRADNTIRQFMATVALGRIAKRGGTGAEAEAARRNLARNLAAYYTEIGGVGAILWEDKAKLGAIALAALAILEFRQAGLIGPDTHRAEFDGLCRGVAALWQEDGSFRTFLAPPDRNDNQNFYPGEALLFWASLHRETRDPDLARRCLQSFRHYRAWHLAQPNPAFVPWHSQAYVMLHEDLGHTELADFVLDRNDWLLAMQQWDSAPSPDFRGRFYDPAHPEYGPPHASATGVYMEGLADAWRLAHRLGDTARAAGYARALRRGLRAIRQLQFTDDLDAWYIQRKRAVMGGLRTETYINEIRVDNVQHCLMALMKIEAAADFPWL